MLYGALMNCGDRMQAMILAGGRSSRMGRDKSTLIIDGRTLLKITIDRLVLAGHSKIVILAADEQQEKFLDAVKMACRIAKVFNEHGARKGGVIRIDSAEFGVEKWKANPGEGTSRIIDTFKKAAAIAADHGERLAAEGEICWAGMHSWKDMLDLLEGVGMPETLGFQADLAHTYLYLMGYNAPEHALLQEGYSEEEFYSAYEEMTDKLRPWTIDFHVAQNDGEVHGAGDHDKTGKHCPADDPNGKLDITRCSQYWLKDFQDRGIKHICWDGCMFPNSTLGNPATWNAILKAMIGVIAD